MWSSFTRDLSEFVTTIADEANAALQGSLPNFGSEREDEDEELPASQSSTKPRTARVVQSQDEDEEEEEEEVTWEMPTIEDAIDPSEAAGQKHDAALKQLQLANAELTEANQQLTKENEQLRRRVSELATELERAQHQLSSLLAAQEQGPPPTALVAAAQSPPKSQPKAQKLPAPTTSPESAARRELAATRSPGALALGDNEEGEDQDEKWE